MRTPQQDQATSTEKAQVGLVKKPKIARRYDVSIRTVENWMRERRIPFVRVGLRGIRFDPNACDRALARFTVKEVL